MLIGTSPPALGLGSSISGPLQSFRETLTRNTRNGVNSVGLIPHRLPFTTSNSSIRRSTIAVRNSVH